MTDKLEKDGNPIDKTSQRVLAHLEQSETGVATSSELRDAAGIEHAQSITYRINQHLEPAGLVEWVEEDTPGAAGTRRLYRLTSEGKEWVTDHRHDLVKPSDIDETADAAQEAREMAQRAVDEAESAKKSVQNYRTKVARLKTRVTGREDPDYEGHWVKKGHEQRIEDVEEQQQVLTERVNQTAPGEQAASNEVRSKENEQEIDDIRGDISDVRDQLDRADQQADISTLCDQLDELQNRLGDVEETQRDILDLADQTNQRLNDLEERQSRGILSRFFGRWGN